MSQVISPETRVRARIYGREIPERLPADMASRSIATMATSRKLATFAWLCLVYIVFVIVWGAFVRASGSGAGCGSHWPLCNGEVLPTAPSAKTLVEFSHRITSGLSLLLVAGLFFWARRSSVKGSDLRRAAGWSFVFILGEAAVGAILVLQHLVAGDSSAARAVVIALHLVNTMFLVAALTWTALLLTVREGAVLGSSAAVAMQSRVRMVAGLLLMVAASGAIVALGDTLFPAKDLVSGMVEDLSPTAHFLVRLRVLHPVLAIGTAVTLWWVLEGIEKLNHNSGLLSQLAMVSRFLLICQVTIGVLNWLLMAPHWLQLVHLGVSNGLWVAVIGVIFTLNRIAKATPVG